MTLSNPFESRPGFLLLEDGTLFHGALRDPLANGAVVAEVVFTTNMTGYQEVFTDPSYSGQIVVMTAPMIGNYGINTEDGESGAPQIAGLIAREISDRHSNWRASGDLGSWLAAAQVPVLEEVDTRQLTRHLRSAKVMLGVVGAGDAPDDAARSALESCPSMEGLDLASRVSTAHSYQWGDPESAHHIVAYDFGIKRNILRLFEDQGCRITVVPSNTPAREAIALAPDGLFLSNGPGDPAAIGYAPPIIRALGESGVPMLGICLGHQLLALSYGAETVKMPYGHRGGNHPVRDIATDEVLITSQNHGFSVRGTEEGIPGAPALEVTHVNLNDGSVEGLRHRDLPIFAVQYHPEAAPGPHDARSQFPVFMNAVAKKKPQSGTSS
ncbi:MAG: glutamine-hydrolyzing carbamoyl-phosphate synthase small subunit [Gemmatimonadaceae bacterium]